MKYILCLIFLYIQSSYDQINKDEYYLKTINSVKKKSLMVKQFGVSYFKGFSFKNKKPLKKNNDSIILDEKYLKNLYLIKRKNQIPKIFGVSSMKEFLFRNKKPLNMRFIADLPYKIFANAFITDSLCVINYIQHGRGIGGGCVVFMKVNNGRGRYFSILPIPDSDSLKSLVDKKIVFSYFDVK